MSSPKEGIDLHTISREYMQIILLESKNCSDEQKRKCVENLCVLQKDRLVNLPIGNVEKTLFYISSKNNSGVANRVNYLVCAIDQASNEKYIYCAVCVLFTTRKNSFTGGRKLDEKFGN